MYVHVQLMVKTSSEDDVDDHAPRKKMSLKEVADIFSSMSDDAEEVVDPKPPPSYLPTQQEWDEYAAYLEEQGKQVCNVCGRTRRDIESYGDCGFDEVAQVCHNCQDDEDYEEEEKWRQGRSEMLESQVLGRDIHARESDGDEEEHLQDNEEFRTKEDQELAKKEREYAEDSASETCCGKCGAVVSFGQSLGTHMAYICDACGNEERDSDGLPEYSDD